MKNHVIGFAIAIILVLSGCSSPETSTVKTKGLDVISYRALPFELTDVRLQDGPFLHATELNKTILLDYDPDRLLSKFYTEAGLKPKGENYMGWENESLAGHSLGHYLGGCSLMYKTTGDQRFLERVNYIVDELKKIQDYDSSGYLGAFPNGRKVFEQEVAKGIIRSQGFDLNGIWSPYYTMHKILAGLRDAYQNCGNKTALQVEKKFADWIGRVMLPLTDDQVQQVLKCEHGGISETLADLYADTGEEKYLDLARLFYHKAILDPLKERKDILPGKHCNTNIPKLIAQSRIYELTGDTSAKNEAKFFWSTVVQNHSYVTGGNGNNEYFGPSRKLRNRLGDGTTESCNVYNMLKLSEHLFEWDASAEVADFYERALFNHILSSQNPENGHVTYNLSLDMGGFKDFQDPFWFTCCIGTAMENHSKYSKNIYYHNDNELFIFQYIASELTWKEKGIRLRQLTGFPEEQGSTLEFSCDKPVKLSLLLRYPYWAENGITVKVNGKNVKFRAGKSSFISVNRTWKTGDRVELSIPFSLRLESMPDDSNRVAVMYGPLVMAGDLGPIKDSASTDAMYVPVLMTDKRDPSSWLQPVEGKVNTFRTINTGRPRDFELKPFYTTWNNRYSVYWDIFNEAAWTSKQDQYTAEMKRLRELKEATIDFIQPGEMQPERDHNFKGEKTTAGSFRERADRESRGGWFSFDMKVNPSAANSVAVEYWGGFPGAKTFDIIVNKLTIATENISEKKEGSFFIEVYKIPVDITRGKSKITIKFQAHPNNTAGPVFGVRTIKE